MTLLKFAGQPARVLDFDIENRPLSYLGSDFTTGEVTAIAARFTDEPASKTHVWVLGVQCQHPVHEGRGVEQTTRLCTEYHYGDSLEEMLAGFHALYDVADIVTGHYILGHDLPVLNGAMLEVGLPALSDKMVHDTKVHLLKRKYLSASQENLGETLGLHAPKVHMNTPRWREANRLTPEGIELTRKRVVGDVRQHIELRKRLMELGWLHAPTMWRSTGSVVGAYTP